MEHLNGATLLQRAIWVMRGAYKARHWEDTKLVRGDNSVALVKPDSFVKVRVRRGAHGAHGLWINGVLVRKVFWENDETIESGLIPTLERLFWNFPEDATE